MSFWSQRIFRPHCKRRKDDATILLHVVTHQLSHDHASVALHRVFYIMFSGVVSDALSCVTFASCVVCGPTIVQRVVCPVSCTTRHRYACMEESGSAIRENSAHHHTGTPTHHTRLVNTNQSVTIKTTLMKRIACLESRM